ncbi:hypothetical protein AVEN_146245-1, partial [Araneus ventricosus]
KDSSQQGKTSHLRLQYFELVTVALHFVQTERVADWNVQLNCVEAMLPMFHAASHLSDDKAFQDMDVLEKNVS